MRGAVTEPDWAILELEEVPEVIEQAARKVYRRYSEHVDVEDLVQDGQILVCTRPNLVEAAESGELGLLQYRLEQDLVERIQTDVKRRSKTISFSRIEEQEEPVEGTFIRPFVALATASNDYTRESVESLLPAVWDETFAYGLPRKDTAPDPDMPRGTPNKATGNDLSAYIADIKVGWADTPLTIKERRALILAYGVGWTQDEIAYNQGVSRRTIRERIETAVGKIVARLNGGVWYQLEGIEA